MRYSHGTSKVPGPWKLAREIIILSIFFIVICSRVRPVIHAETVQDRGFFQHLAFGIFGGYTGFSGYYHSRLYPAPSYGFFIIPYEWRYLRAEFDFAGSSFYVRGGGGSTLQILSGGIGPALFAPVWEHLHPFAGISLRMNYISLNAENINSQENTLKPGFSARGGAFVPVNDRLSARIWAQYDLTRLSGRTMKNTGGMAGLMYRMPQVMAKPEGGENIPAGKIITYYEAVDKAYAMGVESFNRGDILTAREHFEKVLSVRSGHQEAKRHLSLINQALGQFAAGERLAGENRPYEAIPLLELSARLYNNARVQLDRIRKSLAGEAVRLEREGIAAYDSREYRKCIEAMEKVLLINPENKNAGIYLSRARKYLETMEKFR